MVPLSTLPLDAITFALGDSMSVVEQAARRVYSLDEVVALLTASDAVAGFGLSDRRGFQDGFIEVQVWPGSDRSRDRKTSELIRQEKFLAKLDELGKSSTVFPL